MLSREEVELYRRDGYLPGRRLLSPAEAERSRKDCLRTCAKPIELGDQQPYSLKRPARTRSRAESVCVRVLPGFHHKGQLAHVDDHNDPLTMLSRGQMLAENVREE